MNKKQLEAEVRALRVRIRELEGGAGESAAGMVAGLLAAGVAPDRFLVAELDALRTQVAALSPEGLVSGHLAKLAAAAAPYERRLALLPQLEAAVMRWDVVGAERALTEEDRESLKLAIQRLKATELDAREASALNQLYRQQAEVIGVLRARGAARIPAAPSRQERQEAVVVSDDVSMDKARNIVKFLKESGT